MAQCPIAAQLSEQLGANILSGTEMGRKHTKKQGKKPEVRKVEMI
jgi:hypothetical protein